ncbi:CAX-interacting protein 4-like [Quillaja saponaria]|uniref:CAX-interacting protein 4-like n=1 Tax=Quillaja saponaria TaxID=32244 RepID=A0AAD7PCI1_QUISA|nr:CAX-interacting protein 4-like [Quillaja saponaria]
MPATAGRVRMPANNRVHSSAALQTHGIWQSAIGYDPYAPNKDENKNSSQPKSETSEVDAENAYANFQGLLALARITSGPNADVDRGACKKCGRVGHLKFQCKNLVKVRDDDEKDTEAVQLPSLVGWGKSKGNSGKVDRKSNVGSSEDSEEDESESSDSDVDSEIERIIAAKYGKRVTSKGGSMRKKRDSDEDGSDTDSGLRRKRGRSKKRRGKKGGGDSDDLGQSRRDRRKEKRRKRDESTDEEESGESRRKKRKERRRKRDESSDEDDEHRGRQRKSRKEKRRRRSRRSDDSDSEASEDSGRRYRRKSKRAITPSDANSSSSDDSRTGRGVKRSEKRSRKHRHRDEK